MKSNVYRKVCHPVVVCEIAVMMIQQKVVVKEAATRVVNSKTSK